MELFGQTLTFGTAFFLLLALGLALSFEFVNGFHDTANAVATVIYTHSLKPIVAVVWSGCWNLIGVLTSTGRRRVRRRSRCCRSNWCSMSARARDSRWCSPC